MKREVLERLSEVVLYELSQVRKIQKQSVVAVGPYNSGKSAVINALVGDTIEKPQDSTRVPHEYNAPHLHCNCTYQDVSIDPTASSAPFDASARKLITSADLILVAVNPMDSKGNIGIHKCFWKAIGPILNRLTRKEERTLLVVTNLLPHNSEAPECGLLFDTIIEAGLDYLFPASFVDIKFFKDMSELGDPKGIQLSGVVALRQLVQLRLSVLREVKTRKRLTSTMRIISRELQ